MGSDLRWLNGDEGQPDPLLRVLAQEPGAANVPDFLLTAMRPSPVFVLLAHTTISVGAPTITLAGLNIPAGALVIAGMANNGNSGFGGALLALNGVGMTQDVLDFGASPNVGGSLWHLYQATALTNKSLVLSNEVNNPTKEALWVGYLTGMSSIQNDVGGVGLDQTSANITGPGVAPVNPRAYAFAYFVTAGAAGDTFGTLSGGFAKLLQDGTAAAGLGLKVGGRAVTGPSIRECDITGQTSVETVPMIQFYRGL